MKKLAVITGATRGIGKAIAEKFANEGFDLVVCSRNPQQLKTLKTDLENRFNITCHTRVADLSKRKEVAGFVTFVTDLKQRVTVLVNNTGVFIPGKIHEEEEGALETMIETNLYSAYHLTRGLIGEMKANKTGHIFNICSTASITAYENGGSYCISKFAMHGMTKVLREEMKTHGVRVTAILPGATYTSSWEGVELPEERFMKPDDVATALMSAYQLSDQSVIEEIVLRPQLGDL